MKQVLKKVEYYLQLPLVLKEAKIKNQKGQIIIIILLVMVTALAIGLSVAGRSMTEITTSSNTENSSRAFSAAEAGIEKALKQTSTGNSQIDLSNQALAKYNWDADLPKDNNALELPAISKGKVAQFWLAKPEDLVSYYTADTFDIYFGEVKNYTELGDEDNQPGIEVRVILRDASGAYYSSGPYIFDSFGVGDNNGRDSTPESPIDGCIGGKNPEPLQTNESTSPESKFYCKVTVPNPSRVLDGVPGYKEAISDVPILARVRILYSEGSHPVALKPTSGELPPQAKVVKSIGTSGNVQRTLKVLQQKKVIDQVFDYALFSAGGFE
ncbi:MAG: hypothetical protein V1808_02685 [Candidatus Daviesbacteria bacterium]